MVREEETRRSTGPLGPFPLSQSSPGCSMEVTAARKRERGSQDDDWTVVVNSRKKRKNKTLPKSSTTSTRTVLQTKATVVDQKPWFLCLPSEDFLTGFHLVLELEREFGLKFRARKPQPGGGFLVCPTDEEGLRVLQSVREINGRRAHIVQKEATALSKAVICGFPHGYGLELLDRVDAIRTPVRLKSRRTGLETKQVSVFFKGAIPNHIDLGSWGRFAVRPFVPEPVRCYRCQKWGHHQRRCTLPAKCGVCSGAHDTRGCLEKHHSKQQTSACCPNCGGKHHAWNLGCPSRKAQVQIKKKRHQQCPRQESNSEVQHQGEKVKPRPRKRKRKNQKPKVLASEESPPPKVKQRPSMRTKIQLDGNVVSRGTKAKVAAEVAPVAEPSIPLEKLRPILLSVVYMVADATQTTFELTPNEAITMVETALCVNNMGHLLHDGPTGEGEVAAEGTSSPSVDLYDDIFEYL